MKRTSGLRARSTRQERVYRDRRLLVSGLLTEQPWCQIRWDTGCTGRATEVDEILARSAGGSILDESNCQTTCGHCHRMKHTHPEEAVRRGVTIQGRAHNPEPVPQDRTGGTLRA